MQTSLAVSAGGLFTPGGVEVSNPGNAAPLLPTALADFEQHLQQSAEGQTELALPLPAPASEVEVKVVADLTANLRAPAVPAMTVNQWAPAAPAAITFEQEQLPPIVVTSSQEPDQPAQGEPTEEAAIETDVPPTRREPGEPEAPALELAAAAVAAEVAAAARVAVTPQRTLPPQAEREAGRELGASGPDAASVEGDPGRSERPGRVPTVSRGDSREIATSEATPPVARGTNAAAAAAEVRRSMGSSRLPQPAAEAAPLTTTQPTLEDSPEPIGQPTLRQPTLRPPAMEHQQPAPVRSVALDRVAETTGDAPGIERVRVGHRAEREGEVRRTGDIARFQAGAEETAAVNAAMFRRNNLIAFAGTAAAKSDHSMEKGLEQNQFAGLSEQKLPAHGRNALAAELRPPGDRVLEAVREMAFDRADKGINLAADGMAGRPGSIAAAVGSTGGMEATSGSAVRTAEQLLQNMTREVAQFKRFNAESMAVVLKPDAQTEIFLHLASRNGQIEIQARFERGDFASLNGQWAQLQQTLSLQGVRLSNLQEGFQQPPQQSGGGTEWGQGQMQQGQQRQSGREAEDAAHKQGFEEFMLRDTAADPKQSPARPRAAVHRANSVLEAWA